MEFRSRRGTGGGKVQAVRGVSFTVGKGEILGLVGETGSGKTTVGKRVVRLLNPSAGTVRFDGQDITRVPRRSLRQLRARIQMVFQDPYSSLDPRMTVAQIVAEPFQAHLPDSREQTRERAAKAIEGASGWRPLSSSDFPMSCQADSASGGASRGPWCSSRSC